MAESKKSQSALDHESVSAQADRLGLKDSDRARYIRRHMEGFGHKRVESWADADKPGKGGKSGGFFGSDDDDDDEI